MPRTPQDKIELAKAGLWAVAAGAIVFVLVAGFAEATPLTLGRAVVVLGLCYLAAQGHRWAGILLGVLTVIAGLALLITSFRLGVVGRGGLGYLLGAVLYLGGYGAFVVAGGSALFAPSSKDSSSQPGGA